MVIFRVNSSDKPEKQLPNIFHAAVNNDVSELMAALELGQTLDDRNESGFGIGMTAMHMACVCENIEFLEAAVEIDHDPWIRDWNRRLAFDHAVARRLGDIPNKLRRKLYPIGPDGRIIMPFDHP